MPPDPNRTPADRKLDMVRAHTMAAEKAQEAAKLLAEADAAAKKAASAQAALQKASDALATASNDDDKAGAQTDYDLRATEAKLAEEASADLKKRATEADAQATMFSQMASHEGTIVLRSLKERAVVAFSQLSTWVLVSTGLIVAFLLRQVTTRDGEFLRQLADAEAARGLITFLIAGSTVSIAIILIYHAFAEGTTNEKFRFAREIFATLVGVLGTIVGFYFGIAGDKAPGQPLRVGALEIAGNTASTWIASGTPPYTWQLTGSEKTKIPPIDGVLKEAGALNVVVPQPAADGDLTLVIKDAAGNQLTVSGDVTAPKPPASPPQEPAAGK